MILSKVIRKTWLLFKMLFNASASKTHPQGHNTCIPDELLEASPSTDAKLHLCVETSSRHCVFPVLTSLHPAFLCTA